MDIKSGLKSTEFYAMLAGIGAIVWTFVQQNCTFDPLKIYGLVVIVGAYIAGRTYLKVKAMDKQQIDPPVPPTPPATPSVNFPESAVLDANSFK